MFADNILGYGSKRFIEVFFRGFKNDTWGYSSSQPAKTVSVFGATEGRLSILQPSSDVTTKVATKKSLVTIFLDIDKSEVEEYQSDDLATAYWDRESQELVTKEQLKDVIDSNDDVDDSQVAYQSA
tara:strand:+ start:3862 stop:4239 length:378 start_codon:yes stop_codon:yes gene_type:complete